MVKDQQQLGSVLVLTLLMILFLQYIAIAVVNSTNISSQIVGNFQRSQQLEHAAKQVIDRVINNTDHIVNYSKYVNAKGVFHTFHTAETATGLTVKGIDFKCLDLAPMESNIDCDLTNKYWQLIIQIEDLNSNTSLRVVQGLYLAHLSKKNSNHVLQDSQKIRYKKLWWYEIKDF